MKPALAAISIGLLLAAAALALPARDPKPSVYTDGTYGFSIQAPAFPKAPASASVSLAIFSAPAEDGFGSNMNVVVQNVAVTLDEYREASLGQFKTAGMKVNSETRSKISGHDAVVWDYEGTLQGRELRWLAAVIGTKDRIFLVTCTALKKHFQKNEKEFRKSLESFKLAE